MAAIRAELSSRQLHVFAKHSNQTKVLHRLVFLSHNAVGPPIMTSFERGQWHLISRVTLYTIGGARLKYGARKNHQRGITIIFQKFSVKEGVRQLLSRRNRSQPFRRGVLSKSDWVESGLRVTRLGHSWGWLCLVQWVCRILNRSKVMFFMCRKHRLQPR